MTRFFFLLLLSFFLRCALQVFLKLLLSPDRTTLNLSVGFVCVHVRQRGLRLHQRCCCFFPLPALSEIHCKIFFCVGIVSDLIWRVIYFGISGFKKKKKTEAQRRFISLQQQRLHNSIRAQTTRMRTRAPPCCRYWWRQRSPSRPQPITTRLVWLRP